MPLPGPDIKGLGYISTKFGHMSDVELIENDDSRLSSTSLVRTLIDPSSSSSETSLDKIEEERPSSESASVRNTISYLRRDTAQAKEAGLLLNFEEVKKKDGERVFEDQVVPRMSEIAFRKQRRKSPSIRGTGSFIKLPGQISLEKETQDLYRDLRSSAAINQGGRKISGMVGQLMEYVQVNPVQKRRSEYLKRNKEELDKEEMEEAELDPETQQKRRNDRNSREDNVLVGRSESQRREIKKELGSLATTDKKVYIPFGKKSITDKEEDPEAFFEHDLSALNIEPTLKISSYDEYYREKDSLLLPEVNQVQREPKARQSTESNTGRKRNVSYYEEYQKQR